MIDRIIDTAHDGDFSRWSPRELLKRKMEAAILAAAEQAPVRLPVTGREWRIDIVRSEGKPVMLVCVNAEHEPVFVSLSA